MGFFFVFKRSYLYRKWLYSFFLPLFLVLEGQEFRILPKVGDFVVVYYFDIFPAKKYSFRNYCFYGLCSLKSFNFLSSSFFVRNSFQKYLVEFFFHLYSPMLSCLHYYAFRRNFYLRSNLFYLNKKKIANNRFRFFF